MALFSTLVPLTVAQINVCADALHTNGGCLIRVDPRGICLYVTACPNYEVRVVAGKAVGALFLPVSMTQEERERLHVWTCDVIPRLCEQWAQRHPEN